MEGIFLNEMHDCDPVHYNACRYLCGGGDEEEYNVILVHYYRDEDDVVEIVKNHFDGNAYLYND